ncbi:MAG: 3-deoxy-D-manno-octulosonic acid transferase [Duodenibacillus sp.]|nr:3-deoxy-D-manno-octulosonic acid transferase [Duodenibacillus sp.]
MKITPAGYARLASAALPLAKLYLKWRARKQPDYSLHWDERFGECDYPAPGGPRLWIHAVSLGEMRAIKPLLELSLAAFPEAEVLLTSMTPTGRDAALAHMKAHPGRVKHCYLPYDTPELMRKFFAQTRPRLGLVMETEVWPNMLAAARGAGVPVALVNARESDKSFSKAMRFIDVMRPAFATFEATLAQTEEDAARLQLLGARNTVVCGSVKFDIRPDAAQQAAAYAVRPGIGRKVLLLASTRQGEEKLFARRLARLPAGVIALLVPRHPQRFDEVAAMLAAEGVRVRRKSRGVDWSGLGGVDVVLGDTMGEMSFYCALADVCVMGGSFGPFGCQNLIEPAAAGAPVIVGPSSFNFARPVDDAVAMGAAVRVVDADAAMDTAEAWLAEGGEDALRRRKAAGAFSQAYTGAAERMMKVVAQLWRAAGEETP